MDADDVKGAAINPIVARLQAKNLTWFPEAGLGYFECDQPAETVYDAAYLARYAAQADTEIGRALNDFRTGLVLENISGVRWDGSGTILDVGIGDGAFIRRAIDRSFDAWGGIKGFDVNPAGIDWLKESDRWGDLYGRTWPVATFWDSLEHIRDPAAAMAQVEKVAIVSIPIFRDADHVLASKHYRRDEHYWYFTRAGFLRFADQNGFRCVDILASETAIGREDIETFVLIRKADGEA